MELHSLILPKTMVGKVSLDYCMFVSPKNVASTHHLLAVCSEKHSLLPTDAESPVFLFGRQCGKADF